MKPHITIKLKNPVDNTFLHWKDIINNRNYTYNSLIPEVDQVFSKYNYSFRVTNEYLPANINWSEEEINNGFNRTYRLILTKNHHIPPELIKEISIIRKVDKIHKGDIGTVEMPNVSSLSLKNKHTTYSHSLIHLSAAHQFTKGDPSIVIAVLDAGVKTSHPELQECLTKGYDFVNILDGAGEFFGDYLDADDDPDDNLVGHGTHVSGIIAAKGLDMPVGVAPKCSIMPLKVLGAMKRGSKYVGAGLVDNINNAIKYAVDNGADIINMSLGIKHEGGGLPHEEVVEYAKQKDVTIVAASGNDGTSQLYYPGALDHVLSVGALNESGTVSAFSTYGKVSITAPGTNIYSSYINNDYAFASGTSQAAPFVAGAIGLLKSYAKKQGKKLTDKQIKYILKNTADKLGKQFKNRKSGYGKLNILLML